MGREEGDAYCGNYIHVSGQGSRGVAGFCDPVKDEVWGLGFEFVGTHGWRDVFEEAGTDAGEEADGGDVELFGDSGDVSTG